MTDREIIRIDYYLRRGFHYLTKCFNHGHCCDELLLTMIDTIKWSTGRPYLDSYLLGSILWFSFSLGQHAKEKDDAIAQLSDQLVSLSAMPQETVRRQVYTST